MGASESTANTNNNATTGDDEENRRQSQQSTTGTSIGDAVALAAAGVAAVGVTAWTISKMLSEQNSADGHQNTNNNNNHGMESLLANSRQIILQGFDGGKRSIWSRPPSRRLKMNTDGSCHPIPQKNPPGDCVQRGPSGFGGILRDHRGKWVLGFRGYIGKSDCFTAELHGIHKGLELLDKLGHKGAILESDCQAAVEWINGTNTASKSKIVHDSWSIIVECRCLARNNNIDIVHVKGDDANICAHKLADLAIDKKDKYVEIDDEDLSQLPNIKRLVDKDAQTTIGYPSSDSYAY